MPEPYAKKMSQISLLLLEQTDQGLYLFAFTVNYLLRMDQFLHDCTMYQKIFSALNTAKEKVF